MGLGSLPRPARGQAPLFTDCLEVVFSETRMQLVASLSDRTGAKAPFRLSASLLTASLGQIRSYFTATVATVEPAAVYARSERTALLCRCPASQTEIFEAGIYPYASP
jgi:hypothetical protein